VPAITNAESNGRGAVQITIDQTTRTPTFFFQLSGFPTDTRVTAAHIHPGPAGVNGGVIVNSGIASAVLSNPITEFTGTGVAIDPALLQAIVANPAAYYFNVHSSLNPGGFVRGQLVRTQ
jgi:CHRD domain